jgi:filamentous hemagglutinin
VLAGVAEQAVALAARWTVLSGVAVAADAGAAAVVHGPGSALRFVHLDDDVELALVGAVAVPVAGELAAALRGTALAAGANGVSGIAGRLVVGGASLASADALVRAALGQGIDPGEVAMMALPLGAGLGRSGAARTIPLGFADEAAFASFARDLSAGLREAGYGDTVPVFQGSAVTGVKYTTGEPFDLGRRSDFDIALASPALFGRAKAAGVRLRSGGPSRTAPLRPKDLERLGLLDLAGKLSAGADRDVHFMIYEDLAGAVDRSGGIRLP